MVLCLTSYPLPMYLCSQWKASCGLESFYCMKWDPIWTGAQQPPCNGPLLWTSLSPRSSTQYWVGLEWATCYEAWVNVAVWLAFKAQRMLSDETIRIIKVFNLTLFCWFAIFFDLCFLFFIWRIFNMESFRSEYWKSWKIAQIQYGLYYIL